MKSLLLLALVTLLSACGGGGGDSSDGGGGGSDSGQLSGSCAIGRVTNGDQCSLANGPVALLYLLDGSGNPIGICTGSFLNATHVLTAAHCFVDSGASGAQVVTGSSSGFASRITTHPRYQPTEQISPYDMAIVQLAEPQNVSTLPLLVSEGISPGQDISIIGFGADENGSSAADSPASSSLNASSMVINDVAAGSFSAAYDLTGSSICSGDSGGPALKKNRDGIGGILGIAQAVAVNSTDSNGNPICLAGTIAYFTNMQSSIATDFISGLVPGLGLI